MTKKPKPPRIPMSLCRSFGHWLLQIASPSKIYARTLRPTVESEKYFRARTQYKMDLIVWKIENRTCTREEWHQYRRWRRKLWML